MKYMSIFPPLEGGMFLLHRPAAKTISESVEVEETRGA